jgi:hypothetical protein
MNVFALMLPYGAGADATVSREPVPEGFADSLDAAIVNLEGPPTEGEGNLPDVQFALIPDLALLGIASAPPPVAPGSSDSAGAPVSPTVQLAFSTMPVGGVLPAPGGSSNVATGETPETEAPTGQRLPQAPEGVIVASVEVTPTASTGPATELATLAPDLALPTPTPSNVPTPPVTREQATAGAPVDETVTTQPTARNTTEVTVATPAAESEGDSLEQGDTSDHAAPERDSSPPPEPFAAHGHGKPGAERVVELPDRPAQTGVRDALRAMSERIASTPDIKVAGDVRIVLDSVDWGAVQASISVDGGRVETQVQVRDERLAMAMHAQRHELFDRIEAKGLSMDSFQVSRDNPRQGSGNPQPQHGSQATTREVAVSDAPTHPDSTATATWSPTSRWINTTA